MKDLIGQTISHYRIVEKLGSGGMGIVYKARDTKLDRYVALKFLPHHLNTDEEGKQRFIQEAKAASALDHPNICTIHEINETEDGQMYIVMGYYEGQTLKQKLSNVGAKTISPLPVNEIIDIIIQIAQGLSKAHEQGIVHRDIKPANIMITNDGMVKILDFGIAKLSGTTLITQEGTTKGTVSYMSPEQVRGKDVDQRADIWSLGVVLYEMLTGELPFKGDIDQAIIYSILNERPEVFTKLNGENTAELENIVYKCLEKIPTNRYRNADEVIRSLTDLNEAESLSSIPLKKVIQSFISKRFKIISAILILIVAILISVYFIFYPASLIEKSELDKIMEMKQKNSIAIMYFENNTGEKNLDYWKKALSDLLITDLSQSRYIQVLTGDKLFNILSKLDLLEANNYSSESLKEIANQGKVKHILTGNFTKAGETFRINVMLKKVDTGELVGSEMVEGEGEKSFFSMVDELTIKIKTKLDLSPQDINRDVDRLIGEISTSSLEALNYFIEGNNYFAIGYYHECIQLMEKAVAIDTEFARAYSIMGAAYANLRLESKADYYFRKAFELSHRMKNAERYKIQADYYGKIEEHYDKAKDALKKLLEINPFHPGGNNKLAGMYGRIGQWEKAIKTYKINIQNEDYTGHISFFNLVNLYWGLGLIDSARAVIDTFMTRISIHSDKTLSLAHKALAFDYIIREKYDLALIELNKAFSIDSSQYHNFWIKGDIYIYLGDFIKAENEYRKLLDLENQKAHLCARHRMSYLHLIEGKFKKAIEQNIHGIELANKLDNHTWNMRFHSQLIYIYLKTNQLEECLNLCDNLQKTANLNKNRLYQIYALGYKGLIYVETHSQNKILKVTSDLQELLKNKPYFRRQKYYHLLIGMSEILNKNFNIAIENFQKGLYRQGFQYYSVYDYADGKMHSLLHNGMALAYHKDGEMELAAEEYKKITQLTIGRLNYGDIYARSYYMLGKIYQQKGWEGKSIDNYSHFINLWQDCDPEFQWMVTDAREQVDILKKNNMK